MNKFLSSLGVATLLATIPNYSNADAPNANPRTQATGTYSDMHYNAEGGDVIGVEIFILYANKGYYVLFQSAEGEPAIPMLVPASLHQSSIEFTLPENNGYTGKFKGKITPTTLIGSFENGQQSSEGIKIFHLKRKKSYWE